MIFFVEDILSLLRDLLSSSSNFYEFYLLALSCANLSAHTLKS